jgi:hypothetical protein
MEQYGVRLRNEDNITETPTNMAKLSRLLSDLNESQYSTQGMPDDPAADDEDD